MSGINVTITSTSPGVSIGGGTSVSVAVSGPSSPVSVGMVAGGSTSLPDITQLTAGTGITISTAANQFLISSYSTAQIATYAGTSKVTSVAGRTGTITLSAADVSGLSAVATSGSASDLTVGTLPASRLPAATTATLGAVQVGSGLAVANGVLSAIGFSSAPQSPTSNGTAGSLAYDASGYLYVCYATDTWGRVQTNSWLPFTRALLHGDGAAISDSSSFGLTCTTGGTGVAISTSQSKFGGSSLSFSGAGYVALASTPNLYIGDGDFCLEMWVRFNVTNVLLPFAQSLNTLGNASSSNWWFAYLGDAAQSSPQLFFGQHSTANGCGASWSPSANTWYHVAVTRHSGTVRLFIDGVLQSSSGGETVANVSFQGAGVAIGAITTPAYFNGYIDEFRLSVGTARYTATFTPASAAFTS